MGTYKIVIQKDNFQYKAELIRRFRLFCICWMRCRTSPGRIVERVSQWKSDYNVVAIENATDILI